MCVLFVVHGMKNFQGENWPAFKGFLENRRVNIPSSGKSLGYTCALFCVLKEIVILLETVCSGVYSHSSTPSKTLFHTHS